MIPRRAFVNARNLQIVDIRSRSEWQSGSIEGAMNVPLFMLPDRVHGFDEFRRVLVVCTDGVAADIAAGWLREQGFMADGLEGGLERWTAEGYPVVATDGRRAQALSRS